MKAMKNVRKIMVMVLVALAITMIPTNTASAKTTTIKVVKADKGTAKKVSKQALKGKKFQLKVKGNKKKSLKLMENLEKQIQKENGWNIVVKFSRGKTKKGYTTYTVSKDRALEYKYANKLIPSMYKDGVRVLELLTGGKTEQIKGRETTLDTVKYYKADQSLIPLTTTQTFEIKYTSKTETTENKTISKFDDIGNIVGTQKKDIKVITYTLANANTTYFTGDKYIFTNNEWVILRATTTSSPITSSWDNPTWGFENSTQQTTTTESYETDTFKDVLVLQNTIATSKAQADTQYYDYYEKTETTSTINLQKYNGYGIPTVKEPTSLTTVTYTLPTEDTTQVGKTITSVKHIVKGNITKVVLKYVAIEKVKVEKGTLGYNEDYNIYASIKDKPFTALSESQQVYVIFMAYQLNRANNICTCDGFVDTTADFNKFKTTKNEELRKYIQYVNAKGYKWHLSSSGSYTLKQMLKNTTGVCEDYAKATLNIVSQLGLTYKNADFENYDGFSYGLSSEAGKQEVADVTNRYNKTGIKVYRMSDAAQDLNGKVINEEGHAWTQLILQNSDGTKVMISTNNDSVYIKNTTQFVDYIN